MQAAKANYNRARVSLSLGHWVHSTGRRHEAIFSESRIEIKLETLLTYGGFAPGLCGRRRAGNRKVFRSRLATLLALRSRRSCGHPGPNRGGERSAQAGLDSLLAAEQTLTDPAEFARLAKGLVQKHGSSSLARSCRRRRDGYYRRAEEREMELARAVAASDPFDFPARLRPYQQYLDHHPLGCFVSEARQALETIEQEWDKHDFRLVRDHYVHAPGQVKELTSLCQAYLAKHPNGLYRSYAGDLSRWAERVCMPGEYRVTLQQGVIERRLARWFSRGPDVSVLLEVGGVRHGPSNITVNSYTPQWNYEFPRRVRWQLGDPIRIVVTDHDYWDRDIIEVVSSDGDPLAAAHLNDEIAVGGSRLQFSTDFTMPALPTIE